jgi:hypothetical protein
MRGPALPSLDALANEAATQVRDSFGNCAAPNGLCLERVNNNAGPVLHYTFDHTYDGDFKCPARSANNCTGGGHRQRSYEDNLFTWMTSTTGSGTLLGTPGRCNVDPILRQFGFITCTDDCTNPPSGASNLCSKMPYPIMPTTDSACFPRPLMSPFPLTKSVGWNYGATTYPIPVGRAPDKPNQYAQICCSTNAPSAVSATGVCANWGNACVTADDCGGSYCMFTGTCPGALNRPVNSACSPNGIAGECAGGLTCADIGGGLFACQ